MKRLLAMAVVLVLCWAFLGGQVAGAPVDWLPDADGDWRKSTNWSSHPDLPGPDDEVTIDVGGVTIRTITVDDGGGYARSLRCEENLVLVGIGSDDEFVLGAGDSYVNRTLAIRDYSLKVSEEGTFSASGPASMQDGGPNSTIDLSQLNGFPSHINVRATNGGVVDLSALMSFDAAGQDHCVVLTVTVLVETLT